MPKKEEFFVRNLIETEATRLGGEIEVQLLNSIGQAVAVEYVSSDASSVTVGGVTVEQPVILAAARLPKGQGTYVNCQGEEIRPF